jgi:hypothetical protein
MKQLISLTCLLLLLSLPQLSPVEASGVTTPTESAQEEDAQADTGSIAAAKSSTTGQAAETADDQAQKKDADAAETNSSGKQESQTSSRYAFLLNDNGYNYYMDTQNARWIAMPHTVDEQIIDVWIKLLPDRGEQQKETESGSYHYPEKYYLMHYYLRPKTQQIQFLSELEVAGGRPNNDVKERGYQSQNWENLIPDSVEDVIYHGVVKRMKNPKKKGGSFSLPSLRDVLDSVNVSI